MSSNPAPGAAKSVHGIQYSNLSSLNTLDLHFPPQELLLTSSISEQCWIIYIHGGAYRDPAITSRSILPAIPFLFSNSTATFKSRSSSESSSQQPWQSVAAIASLNHRLSVYPDHSSNPSSPADPSRNAIHPDHINDILDAICWLQQHYPQSKRYVLVGHSVGATLAFQAVMGIWHPRRVNKLDDSGISSQQVCIADGSIANRLSDVISPVIALPIAMVGICGIYDFVRLRDHYVSTPIYQTFISSAMGTTDERIWSAASPMTGKYGRTWPEGKKIIVAWSRGDELVDQGQAEGMKAWLKGLEGGDWEGEAGEKELVMLELQGGHDEIWEEGRELARAVRAAME